MIFDRAYEHAIYLDVTATTPPTPGYKSKQRAEIVGSTRKIKAKKGNWVQHAGSIKSGVYLEVVVVFSVPHLEITQTK
jgi:hypothetical protein